MRSLALILSGLLFVCGSPLGHQIGTNGGEANAATSTIYVGPNGDDDGDCFSQGAPCKTFSEVLTRLEAGDTLTVLDGAYQVGGRSDDASHGHFGADCSASDFANGTEQQPIVVRAQNERMAHIKRQPGYAGPVIYLANCSHWSLEGLRVESGDQYYSEYGDGYSSNVQIYYSNHVRLKRLLVHNNNRIRNSHLIQFTGSRNILVEESELYQFHRHGILLWRSPGPHVIRRNFCNGQGYRDLPLACDTRADCGAHADACVDKQCVPKPYRSHIESGGDGCVSVYFSNNSIMENNVSIDTEAFEIVAGTRTDLAGKLGSPGGRNNAVLGHVSYRDLRPGKIDGRYLPRHNGGEPIPDLNNVIKNYVYVGSGFSQGHMQLLAAHDAQIENVTFIGADSQSSSESGDQSGPDAIVVTSGGTTRPDNRPRCGSVLGESETKWTCSAQILNSQFIDWRVEPLFPSGGRGAVSHIRHHGDDANPDVRIGIGYANVYNPGSQRGWVLPDSIEVVGPMTEKNPGMGLGPSQCLLFVPTTSPMKGAGHDGEDIGANVLYRYQDGELTSQPLWNPQTGAFPCGAVVPGSPNDPSANRFQQFHQNLTCSDFHTRVHANAGGCRLPYGSAD